MIFPMRPARLASFWMKDTPSPLDIIFIAPGGTVARIAAMTKPYSLDPIDSGVAVEAVLEIAGGRAEQIGLQPGDRVNWRNPGRSEEHTSELQSLMRISYAGFFLTQKKQKSNQNYDKS